MSSTNVTTVHDVFRARIESGAKQAPTGELTRCGPITIASIGADHRLANSALIFEPPTLEELEEAVEWMLIRDIPFFVWVADAALGRIESAADEVGLLKSDVAPGMVLPSLDDLPLIETDATITEVVDAEDGEEFWSVFRRVFAMPQD